MRRWQLLAWALAAGAFGTVGCGSSKSTPPAAFGVPCASGQDCVSGLCGASGVGASLCTVACTGDYECTSSLGDNTACRQGACVAVCNAAAQTCPAGAACNLKVGACMGPRANKNWTCTSTPGACDCTATDQPGAATTCPAELNGKPLDPAGSGSGVCCTLGGPADDPATWTTCVCRSYASSAESGACSNAMPGLFASPVRSCPGGAATDTCSPGAAGTASDALTLTITAFAECADIPVDYTCAGGTDPRQSPPLSWTAGPAGTMGYAIVLVDKTNNFTHWALWDLPATTTTLAANVTQTTHQLADPAGALQVGGNTESLGYIPRVRPAECTPTCSRCTRRSRSRSPT